MIKVKEITENDLSFVRDVRNMNKDKFFNKMHFTDVGQRAWWSRYNEQQGDDQKDYTYIVWLDDILPIGMLAIYDIDFDNQVAEIGRTLLHSQYRGKGYMTEAFKIVMDKAVALGIKTLKLEVYADNENAIKLYQRMGFVNKDKPILAMEAKL